MALRGLRLVFPHREDIEESFWSEIYKYAGDSTIKAWFLWHWGLRHHSIHIGGDTTYSPGPNRLKTSASPVQSA